MGRRLDWVMGKSSTRVVEGGGNMVTLFNGMGMGMGMGMLTGR